MPASRSAGRYRDAAVAVLVRAGGGHVAYLVPQLPTTPAVVGFHARHDGERLDLIAARYLADATAFWRLCDANDTMVPDALGARALVGVPAPGA